MSNRLDSALVDRAVNALFKYEAKKKQDSQKATLIDSFAKPILVQIQLTKPIAKSILKPVRVKIPNSMFSPDAEEHTICLFCRSEDKTKIDEYISKNPFHGLTKVLSINEVKKFHKEHKDRKQLLREHTHFICDDRIVRQLYNILGSTFGARNNYPIPVDIEKIDKLHAAVQKTIDSTFMALSGQNITIRLGNTSMNQKHVIENVLEGLNFGIAKFKGEWKDVHSIHIKTSDSAALPIYSKVPDEMLKFVATKAGIPEPVKDAKGKSKGKKESEVVKASTATVGKKDGKASIATVISVPSPVKTAPSSEPVVTATSKTPVKTAVPVTATPAAKSAVKVTKPVNTPAPVVATESVANKKRKAVEEANELAAEALLAKVTAAATTVEEPVTEKKSNKKGKVVTSVSAPVSVEEETPVVVAKKGKKETKKTVAVEEPESEIDEPVSAPAVKSAKKKAATPKEKEEVVATTTPARRSTRSK